jgi:hypothetical protein
VPDVLSGGGFELSQVAFQHSMLASITSSSKLDRADVISLHTNRACRLYVNQCPGAMLRRICRFTLIIELRINMNEREM